jgi:hypothetical protein
MDWFSSPGLRAYFIWRTLHVDRVLQNKCNIKRISSLLTLVSSLLTLVSSLLTLVEEGSPLLRSDPRPATCCPPPLVGMGDATDLQYGQPPTPHATPPPPPLG